MIHFNGHVFVFLSSNSIFFLCVNFNKLLSLFLANSLSLKIHMDKKHTVFQSIYLKFRKYLRPLFKDLSFRDQRATYPAAARNMHTLCKN